METKSCRRGTGGCHSCTRVEKTTVPKIFEDYLPGRIYNANKTVLFYHATSDGSLTLANTLLIGSKKAMDCMTVLCCANLSGDDKRPLLIMEKSKKPHCFNCTAHPQLTNLKNIVSF